MINIGAVDTHIDPYTHTNKYSSEPPDCRVLFLLLHDMLQIPEVRFIGIPVNQELVHYASYLVIGLFSFLVPAFRHPCDQIRLCLARR